MQNQTNYIQGLPGGGAPTTATPTPTNNGLIAQSVAGSPTSFSVNGKIYNDAPTQSQSVATTPVTTTPNASTVASGNTTPVTLPSTTSSQTTSTAHSAIANVNALNGNNGTTLTGNQTALLNTTDQNTQNAQNAYDTQASNVQSLIQQYAGMGTDQANQENAAGVPGLQTNSNALTQQYNAAQNTFNQQYQQIATNPQLTTEQAAQQIQSLTQQHGYTLTNIGIQQSIAQNDYNNAETLIQHQIQLKYGALANQISYQQQFLQNNKDLLTQSEQQSFQANLQVQSQMYTQSTYYSQLNASTSMDILKSATANGAPQSTLSNISQLIASGASAGDIATAAGQYGANGNYSIAYNPATGNLEPFNSNTGTFKSGASVPANSPSYNTSDTSSMSSVTGSDGSTYDFSTYATDPQYGAKVSAATSTINNSVGNITDASSMQAAITSFAPTSKLTGAQAYAAATAAGIDPNVFAGQLKVESGMGTSSVALNNNNYGGITYTGSDAQIKAGITQGTARPEGQYYAKFATPEAGLQYQANLDASLKKAPPPITPGQTPTVQSKIQTIQQIQASLPSNISGAVSYINSTGDGYVDLSKVQDLPGYPTGYAKTQATAYAKQFGLAILNDTQVQQVHDYDTAMQNVNTLQNLWNGVAPQSEGGVIGESLLNPFKMAFKTSTGNNLIQYQSNAISALSTLNDITGSKRLSQFSVALSSDSLPQTPNANSGFLLPTGDTLSSGNAKLDNIRTDLNNSLLSISNQFTAAPLSSQIPNQPKSGQQIQIGTNIYNINADGSSTLVSTSTSQ